ncbi:hypothetical protein B5X24_HaOG201709 [Helicoverpa armigera]|nr:hypothetical protein B5X24_HaOG201709 [Helicoverpa armigera]
MWDAMYFWHRSCPLLSIKHTCCCVPIPPPGTDVPINKQNWMAFDTCANTERFGRIGPVIPDNWAFMQTYKPFSLIILL